MPTNSQRYKQLEGEQMKVLFHVPFFSPGVCKLDVIWDDTVFSKGHPTACTDGKVIRWHPEDFDKNYKTGSNVTTACHEVVHNLFGHLWRMPPGGDPEVWNEACDYKVNNTLREFADEVMKDGRADPFPMPADQGWLVNRVFDPMSEEQVYFILMAQRQGGDGGQQQPQQPQGQQQGQGGQGGQGQQQQQQQGQSQGQGQQPGKQPGNKPGQSPSQGQGQPGRGMGQFICQPADSPEAQQQKQQWEATFVQSFAAAKGRGNLPGSLVEMLEGIINPQIPWEDKVMSFLREQAADDWNWMRPNPAFDEGDFIMPSLESERIGEVVFAVDSSGSIDTDVLKRFKGIEQSCLDDLNAPRIREIVCDTQIHADRIVRRGEQVPLDAPGRGGTDFIPVFERLEEGESLPKCLVFLTDMDGSFPDKEPPYPVLWISYSGCGKKAPFGETLEVK